ncbi:MAG: hypothetical protein JWL86_3744 [Rhizobium sp.]|nr:hypothetical protein [Rhizobium sp.]
MDTAKREEQEKFNETLKRMLKTPPEPHKPGESKPGQNKKPDGNPGKKRRPARI